MAFPGRKILDISREGGDKYVVSFSLDSWTVSKQVSDNDLRGLIDSINEARGLNSIIKLFKCSEEQAYKLRSAWGEDGTRPEADCKECQFKRKECFKCQFVCESPLEKTMFLAFKKRGIDVVLQRRIRKDGTYYDYPEDVDKETILTIPDFYLENKNNKVCIYADGKTYHYKYENQVIRDRTIDRELQNLGYKVIRYLGEEIQNDLDNVIDSVMKSVNESSAIEEQQPSQDGIKGFCIRCGKQIELDERRPYCPSCYWNWQAEGGYYNNLEKYCHLCGKEKRRIFFMSPFDDECDAKYEKMSQDSTDSEAISV